MVRLRNLLMLIEDIHLMDVLLIDAMENVYMNVMLDVLMYVDCGLAMSEMINIRYENKYQCKLLVMMEVMMMMMKHINV